jgi:hypothetical protein
MPRCRWAGAVIALVAASSLAVSAQIGGKPVRGGNPTPGTPQPDPPNLADRITLSGCLQPAWKAGSTTGADDANTPSDERFILTNAQPVDRNPPGTGGSELAAKAASVRTFKLEGIESQFSPFVGAGVEISGELRPLAKTAARPTETPTLLVEFVRRISSTCK